MVKGEQGMPRSIHLRQIKNCRKIFKGTGGNLTVLKKVEIIIL
jgi:hypothetical protein